MEATLSESLETSDDEQPFDWRESANRNRWYEIKAVGLDQNELLELEAAIIAFLPERTRGNGVERWIGPIPKHEARTHAEYDAASLLKFVHRRFDVL